MITIKLYGPFCRKSDRDKWHWRKECPDYPSIENPECKIVTTPPSKETLCNVCLEIDMKSPDNLIDSHLLHS